MYLMGALGRVQRAMAEGTKYPALTDEEIAAA
jgi:hypothetical protein